MSGHDPAIVTTATLGTDRRALDWPADAIGPRPSGATDPEALLDLLAVGAALGRAGRTAERLTSLASDAPAPEERMRVAPPAAVSLLRLHLEQNVAGAAATSDLVAAWLVAAAEHDVRAPEALLPPLLGRATKDEDLRAPLRAAGGARAAWLASHRAEWAWFGAADADPAEWPRMGSSERRALLARLRSDPAGREESRRLVDSTWSSDSAKARAEQLGALAEGLEAADEPLLERALDDGAASVREVAVPLLNRLPGSARAARMAERLRPLLSVDGLLRKRLRVELPPEQVDPAWERDGLGDPPKGLAVSRRGWRLRRIIAGAPLEVWAETGLARRAVVTSLADEALAGLVDAVAARRDADWAREFVGLQVTDGALLEALAPADAERFALEALADPKPGALRMLPSLDHAWSREFSLAVARAMLADPRRVLVADPVLVRRVHDDALPELQRLVEGAEDSAAVRRVRSVIQYRSALRSIQEAFA